MTAGNTKSDPGPSLAKDVREADLSITYRCAAHVSDLCKEIAAYAEVRMNAIIDGRKACAEPCDDYPKGTYGYWRFEPGSAALDVNRSIGVGPAWTVQP